MFVKPSTFLAGAALVAVMGSAPATAHNLVMEAYVIGNSIEGEAFFSDGTFAKNRTISVTDASGMPIQEVQTDDKGNFSYVPAQAVAQLLTLDMGSGHVAKVTIAAAALGGAPGGAAPVAPTATAVPLADGAVDDGLRAQVDQIVAAEVTPLRNAIEEYKARNDLLNILGAIGLLCGFAGVLLFGAGAAKAKEAATSSGRGSSRPMRAA